MRPEAFGSIVIALLVALPLSAQIEMPRLTQAIDVRVTNVDVVVTDSNGNRVKGLPREEFLVYDDGKLQPITNFSEISLRDQPQTAGTAAGAPDAAPAFVPPMHVVIFFDCLSTLREDRKRMAKSLSTILDNLRPQDDAMVVSWNRTLKVVVPPTSDRAKLAKGVETAAGEISLRNEGLNMFGSMLGGVPDPVGGIGRSSSAMAAEMMLERRRLAREATANLTESVRGLKGILMRLAGLDGRKALILVSKGFSFAPGLEDTSDSEANVISWLEDLDAPTLLKTLADSANAAGVSIYGFQSEGLHSGWSVTSRGEEVPLFSGDAPSIQKIRTMGQGMDGLNYLAARTGGVASSNSNYFRNAVAKVAEDLTSYYSIGYRSPESTIDKQRTIEVRMRDKRYTVRARTSTIDRSPETEISDRVMSALLFPATGSNELGISANALKVESRGRKRVKIPVDVKIPLANLAFESNGGKLLTASLSIMIASADTTGSVSTIERFHQLIPITRDQLPTLAGKHYTYGMDVDLRTLDRDNRFAIAVLDDVSKATGVVTLDVKTR